MKRKEEKKLQLEIGQTYKDHNKNTWTVLKECSERGKASGYAFLCRYENGGLSAFTNDGFYCNNRRKDPFNLVELVEDIPKSAESPKPKLSLRIGQKYRDHERNIWTVEKECDKKDKAKGYAFLCSRGNGVLVPFTEDGFYYADHSEDSWDLVELVAEKSYLDIIEEDECSIHICLYSSTIDDPGFEGGIYAEAHKGEILIKGKQTLDRGAALHLIAWLQKQIS